jgi:hypothetical protein
MLDKFGRTLIFVLMLFILFKGVELAVKVADPYIRKISASVADSLKAA